jgi:hypothetical protein
MDKGKALDHAYLYVMVLLVQKLEEAGVLWNLLVTL